MRKERRNAGLAVVGVVGPARLRLDPNLDEVRSLLGEPRKVMTEAAAPILEIVSWWASSLQHCKRRTKNRFNEAVDGVRFLW